VLIYHPAFDIYHGIFRILRLLEALPRVDVEVDRIRILDFYLLFPTILRNVRFPIGAGKLKKYFANLENPYENIEDPKGLFMRLEPYQRAALEALAARELIASDALAADKVIRTATKLPGELKAALLGRNDGSKEIELLSGPLFKVDLYGHSGLKERSDLFEYRYDIT
jgi:hypothetical protein